MNMLFTSFQSVCIPLYQPIGLHIIEIIPSTDGIMSYNTG